MPDDKSGRDKQAQDAERRQRKREIQAELERGDEPEPPVDPSELAYFETEIQSLTFPATGHEVVDAIGDRELTATVGTYTIEELVPDTDEETFDSPDAVRVRIQRPTVAGAMKRVVEAIDEVPNAKLSGSQHDAYERTFRELEAIDIVDEDEGIRVVADWILERIDEKGGLPGSREVRRRAATFCRESGYEVRNDEWLGV